MINYEKAHEPLNPGDMVYLEPGKGWVKATPVRVGWLLRLAIRLRLARRRKPPICGLAMETAEVGRTTCVRLFGRTEVDK